MTCDRGRGRVVSFLNLHCFVKGEFNLNAVGNNENATAVNRGSYDWIS